MVAGSSPAKTINKSTKKFYPDSQMIETTEKTNKAELISEAVEAIDYFADQTKTLKQQQKVLFIICGVLLMTTLF